MGLGVKGIGKELRVGVKGIGKELRVGVRGYGVREFFFG